MNKIKAEILFKLDQGISPKLLAKEFSLPEALVIEWQENPSELTSQESSDLMIVGLQHLLEEIPFEEDTSLQFRTKAEKIAIALLTTMTKTLPNNIPMISMVRDYSDSLAKLVLAMSKMPSNQSELTTKNTNLATFVSNLKD